MLLSVSEEMNSMDSIVLEKMDSYLDDDNLVQYSLGSEGDTKINMNELLGKEITLKFTGNIFCTYCQKKIKKTFGQGFCYPCFMALPQADLCQVSPEKCHYQQGTCRDSNWGDSNCFIEHSIYLSLSSDLKVGITRSRNLPNRWVDQGAVEAIILGTVNSRKLAGEIELLIKKEINDKTNWRKMLKGQVETVDLIAKKSEIMDRLLKDQLDFWPSERNEILSIQYPVLSYPQKILSYNFDKAAIIESELVGIKAQYLIFAGGVINIRKFSGYQTQLFLS